jgi:uncharacterized protein (TIGR02145 family)
MKTKNRIWLCQFIVMGLVLILTNNCKKEKDKVENKITDKDGNVYTSVTIGTQVWMVENLKTTKFNNGDLIGTTTPANLDIIDEINPKYQWAYEGNESNVAIYGRLYTWYAITDARGVCPTGWQVASESDWTTLIDYLGGLSVAGGKLKETSSTHWNSPNTGATNETGFTALPGGTRYDFFGYLGVTAYFWSSTEYSSTNAWRFCISYDVTNVYKTNYFKYNGHSIRCIKD